MEMTVTVGGRAHQRFMRTQGERDDLFRRATKQAEQFSVRGWECATCSCHRCDVPVRPGRQQGFPLRIRFALILRRIGVVIAARLGPFGIELAGSGLDVLAGEPPHVVTPWVSHPAVIGTPHVAGAPWDSLMASAQRLMGTCGVATPGRTALDPQLKR